MALLTLICIYLACFNRCSESTIGIHVLLALAARVFEDYHGVESLSTAFGDRDRKYL